MVNQLIKCFLFVSIIALPMVAAWAVFAPLLAFPIVGFWRQRRLIERVEHETLKWLAARHRAGCIDV